MREIAFHRLDQVRDQVVAARELHVDLRETHSYRRFAPKPGRSTADHEEYGEDDKSEN